MGNHTFSDPGTALYMVTSDPEVERPSSPLSGSSAANHLVYRPLERAAQSQRRSSGLPVGFRETLGVY